MADVNNKQSNKSAQMCDNSAVYALVANIPSFYHSSDLRNYFSQFIERGGFECFHFRHRPEIVKPRPPDVPQSADDSTTDSASSKANNVASTSTDKRSSGSLCCVVRLQRSKLDELVKMYHRRCWLDKKGESMRRVCCISKIKVADSNQDELSGKFRTREEMKKIPDDRQTFTSSDLLSLPELHPPALMPNGNVGTPTAHFLRLIQQCRLPSSLISKLGLVFPRTRSNRMYGNVPLEYDGELCSGTGDDYSDLTSAHGTEILTEKELQNITKHRTAEPPTSTLDNERVKDEDSESDDDDCEEWERHEALNNDPSNYERNKERLYEEEMEIVWEKGGPGIVWYTDAQFWDELDGNEEEKDVDDWDVDMGVYYDPEGGDKDARDMATMRRDVKRRDGKVGVNDSFQTAIGKFEQHSKGVGRKVMNKFGWKEGESLGSSVRGIVDALDAEGGQKPTDKSGLGYRGEKLQVFGGPSVPKKPRLQTDRPIITTIYDNPDETDPPEPLLRRQETTHLKYRHSFCRSTQSTTD